MAVVTLHARGTATPELAWERYAVPAVWPDWAPQIRRVSADAERLTPGMRGTVHGPVGVSARFVVDLVDERSRRWVWRVRRGPVRVRLEHAVRADGDGCATTLIIDAPLGLAAAYAPLAQLALRRLVRGPRQAPR